MKENKSKIARLLVILSVVTSFILCSLALIVMADDSDDGNSGPEMMMHLSGLSKGNLIDLGTIEGSDYSGSKLKWRVLDSEKDNAGNSGAVFVWSEGVVGHWDKKGNPTTIPYYGRWYNPFRKFTLNNFYHNSDMPPWCSEFSKKVFAEAELNVIRPVSKKDPGGEELGVYKDRILGVDDTGHNTYQDVTYEILTWPDEIRNQKVFIPSYKELKKQEGLIAKMDGYKGANQYWLRDPGEIYPYYDLFNLTRAFVVTYTDAGVHQNFGKTHDPAFEYDDITRENWTRPAMNIESSAVLFSNVAGVKEGVFPNGTLKEINQNRDNRNEWELTLEDPGHRGFDARGIKITVTEPYNWVEIGISGMNAGKNERISAIVTDGNSVLYYGCFALCENSVPEKIQIPISWDNKDAKLYVFSERYDGKGKTSYASPLQYVDLNDPAIAIHTVSYDMNGHGSPQPTWEQVEAGEKAHEPEAPSAVGYKFLGWFKEKECRNKWDFNNEVTEDMVLYAGWEAHEYKVQFDANGGGGSMSDQSRYFGDEAPLQDCGFTAPKKDGKDQKFTGWNDSKDGSGNNYYPGDTVDLVYDDRESIKLYAQWSDELMVYYHLNGHGTRQPDTETTDASKGWKITKPEDPSEEGFSFGGWYTTPSCDGDAWDFENDSLDTNTTLFAKWIGNDYKIIYIANGQQKEQSRNCGDGIPLEGAFNARDYQILLEWNTDSDGIGDSYEEHFTGDVTKEKGATVTLYAIWTNNVYTVYFNNNGGYGQMNPQSKEYGDGKPLTANEFKRDDHYFKCWNTKADGSGRNYPDLSTEDIIMTASSSTTLYAQWGEKYTVHFDANGGEGKMDDQVKRQDDGIGLTPNSFTYDGCSFAGWNTAEDGSGRDYPDGYDGNIQTNGDDRVTLYAQWKNSYKVHFHANGGKGEMKDQDRYSGDGLTLSPNEFSKDNNVFIGWNTSPNGKGESYTDEDTADLTDEPNGIVSLYAQWGGSYTVHFDSNGGEGNMDDQVRNEKDGLTLSPNKFTKENGAFVGWNTKKDGTGTPYTDQSAKDIPTEPGDSVTLYAQWIDACTVTFNTNNGSHETQYVRTTNKDGHVSFPDDPSPADPEAWFYGWYTEREGGISVGSDTRFGSDTTVYAHYRGIKYKANTQHTITFHASPGSINPALPNNQMTTDDEGVVRGLPVAKHEQFVFDGWYTMTDGKGIEIKEGTVIWEDTDVYAHYSSYCLSFDGNEGEGKMEDQLRSLGDNKTLPVNEFTRDGFVFREWNVKKDGSGKAYSDAYRGDIELDGSINGYITLYAQWDEDLPKSYQVVFDVQGHGEAPEPELAKAPDWKVAEPSPAPSDEGYTLEGWYTDRDCTVGNEWDFNNKVTDDMVLYAKWVGNSYTISFNPGKGVENEQTGHMEDQQRVVGDGKALPSCLYEPPAHSSGALFTGWNTKADGSGDHFDDRSTEDVATGGKVTLYAQWSDTRIAVFNLNGHGDKAPAPQMRGQMHEYKLIEPETEPTEAGYLFTGWYRSEECKPDEKWDFDNDSLTKPLTTLYAGWEPIAYTVKFDANAPDDTDTEGSMDGQERLFDDGKALPEVAYILTDTSDSGRSFVFSGWNTEADGSGDAFGDQDSQNITDAEGEVTLYAMWNFAQITTSRLPRGTQGEDYSYTLSYAGLWEGVPVEWSIAEGEGSLPDGFTLDSASGVISGNSDQAGRFDFTVKLTGADCMGDLITLKKPLYITLRQIDPEPLVIQFTEGMDGIWEKGGSSDLSFKTNGPFEMFEGVDVDGVELEKGRDYTAEEGSTIIKLKPSYLESLSDGSHILTAHYNDGQEPFTQFTITTKPDDDDKDDDKDDPRPTPDNDDKDNDKDNPKPTPDNDDKDHNKDNPKPSPDNDDKNEDNDKDQEEITPEPDDNDNDASPNNGDGNGNNKGNGNKRRGANTGDDNHVAMWISLMLITASAIICLIMIRQRRRI